jgi:hypothetical protein
VDSAQSDGSAHTAPIFADRVAIVCDAGRAQTKIQKQKEGQGEEEDNKKGEKINNLFL